MDVARRGRAQTRAAPARISAADRAARIQGHHELVFRVAYLLLVSALVGLALGVLGSDLFAIRDVQVVCANPSLQAEAAERAEGLSFGTIWLPPTRAVERHIGGLPRARSVAIGRDLPTTLTIVVEPRVPSAVVAAEERYMAIDDEGVCLHWTGAAEDLPTVHLENPAVLEVGGTLPERDVAWLRATLGGLSESGLSAGASIDLSHPLRISVFTADGVLGKLGNDELLYEKTLLFAELLDGLREQGRAPLYIDLRVPSRPTYKSVN